MKRGDASMNPTEPPNVQDDPEEPIEQPEPTPLEEPKEVPPEGDD